MALDAKAVDKPFKKLRKLLKNFPDSPAAEDVHDVRTHTRRIEAIAGAFRLRGKKEGRELIKDLKAIRKAAGDVRDMDVLTELAASIDPRSDGDCRLKLMQNLSDQRTRAATKLVKKVNGERKELRSELKDCRALADANVDSATSQQASDKQRRKGRAKAAGSMASSLEIEQELRAWPKLNKENIHPFRLKVKELRYTLQLGENNDSKLTEELGNVKDQIGLWHDWNQLAEIAEDVLDHGAACDIAAQIRARTKQELQKALVRANALRSQYLLPKSGGRRKTKAGNNRVSSEIHPAVISATSRLTS